MKPIVFVYPCLAVVVHVAGCATPPGSSDVAARREMLALLMPSRIEIIESFTRVKSFDDDAIPDGIELFLEAVNTLDNPGLMITGRIQAALYQYVPASGDQKGQRLQQWDIELDTVHQQRRYWNALTQMYEFRLGIDPSRIPPASKYVLAVLYSSPLGEHLSDECILSYESAGAVRGLSRPPAP